MNSKFGYSLCFVNFIINCWHSKHLQGNITDGYDDKTWLLISVSQKKQKY